MRITALQLTFVIAKSDHLKTAQFTRELVPNNIMTSMKGVSSMLFTIEAMVAVPVTSLSTREREWVSRASANREPQQQTLIERHLML